MLTPYIFTVLEHSRIQDIDISASPLAEVKDSNVGKVVFSISSEVEQEMLSAASNKNKTKPAGTPGPMGY